MKAILIGLNNPLSPRPSHALVPYPAGCTGHRLVEMIRLVDAEFDDDDYYDAFERFNVWRGRELPEGRGRTALLEREGRVLRERCLESPREVVILGAQAWSAVTRRTPPAWLNFQMMGESTFWYLPHPSGSNRIYNDPDKRLRAGRILYEVALRALGRDRREEVRA